MSNRNIICFLPIHGFSGLASVAGWRLLDGRTSEEKLVTVFNKFNLDLFGYNGAAEWYNSPNQNRNTS